MNKSECKIHPDGTKEWLRNGEYHRWDGPAIEHSDGTKYWFMNGNYHREGGPAIERCNGTKEWWINGCRHREGGPAFEGTDGTKYWFLNGKSAHPEAIVDLWLEREIFCWYDETNDCLNFGEKDEQT